MDVERIISEAMDGARVEHTRSLSGGCIHRVFAATLDDGRRVVAKLNEARIAPMFAGEAVSLKAIAATDTVSVPTPIVHGVFAGAAVLIMTEITPAPPTARAWRRLGEALAALHAADAGTHYGFEIDNHLGTTPQPNRSCDDWVEFNAEQRLGHQFALARDGGGLNREEGRRLQTVIDRLDRRLPSRPHPALLHGDLWSGNALPSEGEHIAIIDPAAYVGDGWADIAMMRLFGGFSAACFDAYADAVDDHDDVETRIAVYQLYHVLNHVNLFGRGYTGQAMALVDRLT